jgi:hypothetical protein
MTVSPSSNTSLVDTHQGTSEGAARCQNTGSTVDDLPMVADDLPPLPDSSRARKLQLRHLNEKKRRHDARYAERPQKPGFDFVCPLCPGLSYFNRSGLLSHL